MYFFINLFSIFFAFDCLSALSLTGKVGAGALGMCLKNQRVFWNLEHKKKQKKLYIPFLGQAEKRRRWRASTSGKISLYLSRKRSYSGKQFWKA